MTHRSWIRFAAAAAIALASAARADAPVAQVVALEGNATADAATLALGDSIVAGSVVRTGADGKVGFLASQIYVQLDPQSALKLDRDASGHVKMALSDDHDSLRFNAAVAWASFEIPPNSGPRYRAGIKFIDADQGVVGGFCQRHKS
jgi:hypothetical protein